MPEELGRLAIPTFTVGASFTEELGRLAIPKFTVCASFRQAGRPAVKQAGRQAGR